MYDTPDSCSYKIVYHSVAINNMVAYLQLDIFGVYLFSLEREGCNENQALEIYLQKSMYKY